MSSFETPTSINSFHPFFSTHRLLLQRHPGPRASRGGDGKARRVPDWRGLLTRKRRRRRHQSAAATTPRSLKEIEEREMTSHFHTRKKVNVAWKWPFILLQLEFVRPCWWESGCVGLKKKWMRKLQLAAASKAGISCVLASYRCEICCSKVSFFSPMWDCS